MNAETRILERNFQPYAARLAPLPPDGQVRVLQLGPALSAKGGITSVSQLIMDYLAPYVSVRHVATFDDGSAFNKASIFARAVQELRRVLEQPEPTIVHIHFASRGSTLRKMILAEMVARAGRPLVLHAHGSEFDLFHRKLPAAVRRNLNRTMQRASAFLTLSNHWRNFYVDECELSPSQVYVLPNPVCVPTEVPDRSGNRELQIVHLGRLGNRKGVYDLVSAFLGLPDALKQRARLIVAGDGEIEGVRRLAQAGGDRVLVPGWIDSAERNRLLVNSDIFALASRAEGVPMALLEAMAYGLPSLTTPVGGIPDVFDDGVHGVLVQPGNVEEIRAGLARLITDDAFRLSAGHAARESVRQYDVHNYARRLADIYQRIAPVAEIREIA